MKHLPTLMMALMCTLLLTGLAVPAAGQASDPELERRIRELGVGAGDGTAREREVTRLSGEAEQGPPLTDREIAVHVLNRLAFGPRPGQVDEVMQMGWENWVKQQLRPGEIAVPYVDETMREKYPSVGMEMGEIFRTYRPPYKSEPPTREEQDERNRLNNQVRRELRESTLYRAVYSDRQFEEVICEFWRNHLSIDQNKDDVAYLANNWEQDVIRRFAFGKFEHMLLASARHPAMLIFLDNHVSQRPLSEREEALIERYSDRRHVPSSVLALSRTRGLNENYARELMELHSLGVDREYTQRDVTELARVLTGWSARWSNGQAYGGAMMNARNGEGQATYGFYFNQAYHDDRDKVVLGTRLNGGGEEQGIMVVRALARHPYTADFIARKLCRYLLRDNPSEELVAQVKKVYQKTDGDLPSVYEAIIFSDDFLYRQNHQVKFKTPFEFVVSSLRATGAEVTEWSEVNNALTRMGQAIYQCPDPTGYYDMAESWLDPGVMVYRWDFALNLANNRISGVRLPEALLANQPYTQMVEKLESQVVPNGLSERTRKIMDETLGGKADAGEVLGIMLGSPDFQTQ